MRTIINPDKTNTLNLKELKTLYYERYLSEIYKITPSQKTRLFSKGIFTNKIIAIPVYAKENNIQRTIKLLEKRTNNEYCIFFYINDSIELQGNYFCIEKLANLIIDSNIKNFRIYSFLYDQKPTFGKISLDLVDNIIRESYEGDIYILRMDIDTIYIDKDYLSIIFNSIKKYGCPYIQGNVRCFYSRRPHYLGFLLEQFFICFKHLEKSSFSGGSGCFSLEEYLKIGGFDPFLETGEDQELGHMLEYIVHKKPISIKTKIFVDPRRILVALNNNEKTSDQRNKKKFMPINKKIEKQNILNAEAKKLLNGKYLSEKERKKLTNKINFYLQEKIENLMKQGMINLNDDIFAKKLIQFNNKTMMKSLYQFRMNKKNEINLAIKKTNQ